MAERYEFAELSFDKDAGHKLSCDFDLLNPVAGDDNMGETHYAQSWVDVLPELGAQGWFIGGIMDYELGLRSLLLQRKVETVAS